MADFFLIFSLIIFVFVPIVASDSLIFVDGKLSIFSISDFIVRINLKKFIDKIN